LEKPDLVHNKTGWNFMIMAPAICVQAPLPWSGSSDDDVRRRFRAWFDLDWSWIEALEEKGKRCTPVQLMDFKLRVAAVIKTAWSMVLEAAGTEQEPPFYL
jgi:hypothetical protein